MNLIIFGYRGYGRSEGIPSEKGLLMDGSAIAHYVFESRELENVVDRKQVFLFGRSLGGAVAASVSLEKDLPFKGIIIENTFTTMADLVDIMFPPLYFIKNYLLKTKFETKNIIGKIQRPILFCRSELDELIPKNQMDTLYNLANGALFKEYYIIKGGSHNDGFNTDKEGYAQAIKNFTEKCNEFYKNYKENNLDNKNNNENNNLKQKIE